MRSFKLKMYQIRFRPELRPGPCYEAYGSLTPLFRGAGIILHASARSSQPGGARGPQGCSEGSVCESSTHCFIQYKVVCVVAVPSSFP